jgi:cytochrome c biogenesis protein CcmG/thiol:disulfide interchange protein DsbE
MTGSAVSEERGSRAIWAVIAAGLLVVVLGVVLSSRFGSDPTLIESPLIGRPAPATVDPYLEFDGTFSLDQVRGDITVVNFWASWCLSCRDEHAAFVAAAPQYAESGVTFVGVLHQDDRADGLAFLSELGRPEPFVFVHDDDSRTGLEFGVFGLPETYFIGRDGTILGKVSGPVSYGLLTDTLDTIILGGGADLGVVKTGEVQNAE